MIAQSKKSPDATDVQVGVLLRARREQAGISQARLGQLAGGVTFQQIQKYENGANRITVGRLVLMAGALGCKPAELLPSDQVVQS